MSQNRIELFIAQKGVTKQFLARKLGVSRPTLDRKIAENADDFYKNVRKIVESNTIAMPVHGYFYPIIAKVNAGELLFHKGNILNEPIFFNYDVPPEDNRCFAFKIEGDSMVNGSKKSIDDGDYVLVDMQAVVLPGDVVVAVLQNGRELIKQYVPVDSDTVKLVSFNNAYPEITLKREEIIAMYRVMRRAKIDSF